MTDAGKALAVELVKARLNRADNLLDEYLASRVEADAEDLTGKGIALTDSSRDIMLLADYAAWNYGNRDKAEGMPEWLRLKIRERWLQEVRQHDA